MDSLRRTYQPVAADVSLRAAVEPERQAAEPAPGPMPNEKISDFLDRQLTWVQPRALKREYELRAGDKVVAALRFKNLFSSFATGESADGCWTFERERVRPAGTRVTVRACGSDADIAVFHDSASSHDGTLEFADRRRILAASNFWETQYAFKTADGELLFRLRTRGLLPQLYLHLRGTVEIAREGAAVAEPPWMLMLGWYLMVMMLESSRVS